MGGWEERRGVCGRGRGEEEGCEWEGRRRGGVCVGEGGEKRRGVRYSDFVFIL